MKRMALAVGIAVVVIGVLLGGAFVTSRLDSNDDQSGQVKTACREWVKDRLKAPTTAAFSGEAVSRKGDTYVVTGAVDADNSFGAPIRDTYQCEATNDGESSRLIVLNGLGD